MAFARSEKEVRAFYERWKGLVFRICLLFLGNEERATDATAQAFAGYVRDHAELAIDKLPPLLVRLALGVTRSWCAAHVPPASRDGDSLQGAILRLPCEQRAVFILRNVLGMDRQDVSEATGLSLQLIGELWIRSMLTLRERLPREFFKEQMR